MNVTIDPKISAVVNLLVSIVAGILGASAEFTTLFGAGTTQHIMQYAGYAGLVLGIINSTLHGLSSSQTGPLVKGPPNA